MPSDHSSQLTPGTLGDGVVDPAAFQRFSAAGANVVRLYHYDPDASVVVWNLEPGQVQSLHTHPGNLHVFYVLAGAGELLRGDDPPVPISEGRCVIVPRERPHGVRNNGTTRLSYLAVSTYGAEGYLRVDA